MERFVIFLSLLCCLVKTQAQCAYTCSNYIVSPISYSLYPTEGTEVFLADDDVTTTLPLNFNFDFYCNTYNQVRICSNGFITFDFTSFNTANTPYAQYLPSTTSPNAVIAWNWNDLDPSAVTGAGRITYTTIGTSPDQRFVVTYSAVPIWTNNAPPSPLLNTGQIVLHESSNIIEIHIKEATNNGWLTHSEGIEDATGSNGASVFLPPNKWRNLSLWQATNSSHMFSPYSITTSLSVSGTTAICEGLPALFNATASPSPLYYNWITPPGWAASSGTTTYASAAGAAGTISVTANYSCGASFPATIMVNVSPAPVITVSPVSPSLICAGTVFTVNVSGASSYTLLPGGVSGGPVLTHTAAASTIYSVSGSSAAGCLAIKTPTVKLSIKDAPLVTVNSGGVCDGETFTMVPAGAVSYSFSNGFNVVTPPPGVYTYSVTGTGTNGCASLPAISHVTVHALPQPSIKSARTLICRGETHLLTASGAATYLWLHDSTTASSSAVTPTAMSTYSVRGTDVNGCSGLGKYTLFVSSCVGIEASAAEAPTWIYPNPFAESLTVVVAHPSEIRLSDMSGKVIYNAPHEAGKILISAKTLPPGLYLLRIRSGEQELHYKVVKPL